VAGSCTVVRSYTVAEGCTVAEDCIVAVDCTDCTVALVEGCTGVEAGTVVEVRGRGCRCYGQMGAAGPETILARSVRDGPPLAARVHIAVRSVSVTVHVGLFFELYTVFLRVGGPKRAIPRQVALFTQNGSSLRVITVLRH